jgi:hypothetical protein
MPMLQIACLSSHDPGEGLGEALGVMGLRTSCGDIVTYRLGGGSTGLAWLRIAQLPD